MNANDNPPPAPRTTPTPARRRLRWLLLSAGFPWWLGCEEGVASPSSVEAPSAPPPANAPLTTIQFEVGGAPPAPDSPASSLEQEESPRPLATAPELGSSLLAPPDDASVAPASEDAAAGAEQAAEDEQQDPAEPSTFQPCPVDGSTCAILPLGDSITFGEGSSGGGYRVELFRQAVQAGQPVTFIGTANPNGPTNVEGQPFPRAHQGHQGFVIDEGGFSPTASLSRVLDETLPVLDPHIVLLMAGTNDINGNNNLAQAPARLVRLLDQIDASEPQALVVVAQLTPTRDAVLNARIETFNAAIAEELAAMAAAGRSVAVVDMFTPFVETPDYQNVLLFDRLHPNDAGYAIMVDVWYEAIEPLLPKVAGASQ